MRRDAAPNQEATTPANEATVWSAQLRTPNTARMPVGVTEGPHGVRGLRPEVMASVLVRWPSASAPETGRPDTRAGRFAMAAAPKTVPVGRGRGGAWVRPTAR